MKKFLIFTILFGTAGYFGAKWYLHNEVENGMNLAVLMMAPYADVEYDGVASTLTGELTVEGIRVRVNGFQDTIRIDRFGIDTPSFLSLLELGDIARFRSDELPKYFGFLVEGVHLTAGSDYYRALYDLALQARGIDGAVEAAAECTGKYGFSPQALMELGYREQVVSTAITIRNQPNAFSLDVAMSMDDMWDVDASVTLAGDLMTEMSKGMAYRPRLSSMVIEMTDQSLNRRVADYCARRGLSAEQVFEAQLDAFRFMGEENGIEFDEYVLDPYREFLGGKSTLIVTARPNSPIAFSQISLYKPSDVPALLNLEASAL